MQSGKVLNPQEREAVNKVMQSMLFIVTGDSQVFNKARQHTQKIDTKLKVIQKKKFVSYVIQKTTTVL